MAISIPMRVKTPHKGRGLAPCLEAYHSRKNTTSETHGLGPISMSNERDIPEWTPKAEAFSGHSNRKIRFEKTAKSLANAILRNRPIEEGGCGCPVLVEGMRDERTLREIGFTGPIEKMNRGWDRSRLIAFLHSEYCSISVPDGKPPIILLMDWDRTGGKLQASIRDRLMAMDVIVDEDLRNTILRTMKPEGRTVESLLPHSNSLVPLVHTFLEAME